MSSKILKPFYNLTISGDKFLVIYLLGVFLPGSKSCKNGTLLLLVAHHKQLTYSLEEFNKMS
jgi:hypothetical protein